VQDLYVHKIEREKLLQTLKNQGYVKDFAVQLKRKNGEHFHALKARFRVAIRSRLRLLRQNSLHFNFCTINFFSA
jgi:ribosomal protein S8